LDVQVDANAPVDGHHCVVALLPEEGDADEGNTGPGRLRQAVLAAMGDEGTQVRVLWEKNLKKIYYPNIQTL
jgi:hypothetical protein